MTDYEESLILQKQEQLELAENCNGECEHCPFVEWTTPRYFYEEPKAICTLFEE